MTVWTPGVNGGKGDRALVAVFDTKAEADHRAEELAALGQSGRTGSP
jgi:hypothetical protein